MVRRNNIIKYNLHDYPKMLIYQIMSICSDIVS